MSAIVAAKVKSEMYKQGITQKELAEILGVSCSYISDIINGKKTGKKAQEHAKHIRKILGIKGSGE
ncbi:helix-turn-helix domain-containing protein [Bacillus safensis]|uniref:helix-turn-helix transcriptional regulator n=1 Tax=Bacillus TaxID=1386 RepID=UPI000D2232F9|nr:MULTISPECIES: helix-turn-helix domain-containing protein [Bacillus]AVI41031.1 transcriptional regulator [Bacillus pumilus]MBW4850905.1 helix-turn-helix domain-containing protein [Bacillaceae bacterium]MBW4851804.1 helix-turn-helix domain-containing protein [Bacillaceae bacterium]MBW4855893.1 helix-turn-helix domain-containing protein [Bacillaceae bacterium]